MKNKKVCFFIGSIQRSGGTERVTSLIANKLSQNGCEITILSFFNGKKSFFELDENIQLRELYKKPVNGLLNMVRTTFRLRRFLKKEKIDFIIDVDTILSLNSIPASIKLDTKVIAWEHFNFYSTLGIKRRAWGRALAAKYAHQIITLTEEDKNHFLKNLNVKSKIDYIYNPNPYPDRGSSTCKNKIAIAVGRLEDQKGFDKLLNIWAKVEKQNKEWKLQIIGSGSQKKTLVKQKEKLKLKRVEFIENTNKIEEYYQNASIYLMTSRFEGLPMTLIEAQSFSLPVISYDVKTGPKDIVKDNVNGYLIPDDDEKEFINKFLMLADDEDKRLKMSKESINLSKRFDINVIIKKWKEIIDG